MRSDRIAKTKKAAKDQIANQPKPPGYLSKKMKGFWRPVFELNNPQPYQVLILVKACEANDRAEQARPVLKKEGLTFLDRFEKPKPRPEIAIELTNKPSSRRFYGRFICTTNIGSTSTIDISPAPHWNSEANRAPQHVRRSLFRLANELHDVGGDQRRRHHRSLPARFATRIPRCIWRELF